jgi:hypothetical protein
MTTTRLQEIVEARFLEEGAEARIREIVETRLKPAMDLLTQYGEELSQIRHIGYRPAYGDMFMLDHLNVLTQGSEIEERERRLVLPPTDVLIALIALRGGPTMQSGAYDQFDDDLDESLRTYGLSERVDPTGDDGEGGERLCGCGARHDVHTDDDEVEA